MKRSPTLDGSVPLRVAQACVPLLEGNAWGHQIALHRRIELRRRLGGWTRRSSAATSSSGSCARRVPLLVADGTLRGARGGAAGSSAASSTRAAGISRVHRPVRAAARRACGCACRRPRTAARSSYTIDGGDPRRRERVGAARARHRAAPGATRSRSTARSRRSPRCRRTSSSRCALADAPERRARRTSASTTPQYFATKKRGQVARKYRDEIARDRRRRREDARDGRRASTASASSWPGRARAPAGGLARGDGAIGSFVTNAVAFTATFDGSHVTVEPDRDALARYASAVQTDVGAGSAQTWPAHPGALLYLTKYFTPHPPGEPHFFVKPCALVRRRPACRR